MFGRRKAFEAKVLRHGPVDKLAAIIEAGGKPDYDDFCGYLEGTNETLGIDETETRRIVEEEVQKGNLRAKDFDVVISSDVMRAKKTAQIIKDVLKKKTKEYSTNLLREIRIPAISREDYESAADIYEVRRKYITPFLEGKTSGETPVVVYRRAERALEYLRRVCTQTRKKPLLVSHGLFLRFLELAIDHQGQKLSDEEVHKVVNAKFRSLKAPDLLQGHHIRMTAEGKAVILR